MLQAKLKVVEGRHHGKTIPLTTKKFLIGREQDCHLRPNSELVSRHHCVFAVDDHFVRVRDLGSTNGTYVNGERIHGEVLLNSGDRIQVGRLDFELVLGEPLVTVSGAKGDSSQILPSTGIDVSAQETAPLGATDTSFEIPVAIVPEDTGSSILPTESLTPAPGAGQPAISGDSTVVWTAPAAPSYAPEAYPPMGYPQNPYQPAYPYMTPGMGYQAPMPYPQMPMGYPGMYPQMGQMGMYPPPAYNQPQYAPQPQPATLSEPQEDDPAAIPAIRLPDPKTTGAKAPAPPPPPAAAAASDAAAAPAVPSGEQASDEWAAKKDEAKAAPEVKPSQSAASILKNYVQRRPV